MILVRSPYRISLFGGGSDFPDWYREHGGKVIGFAINRYCWIGVRKLPPFFPHRHRIVYSQVEAVRTAGEIQHPAVRAIFNWFEIGYGLEIHHDGDLPAWSGIGSSSSFTVALLHALYAMRGEMRSPRQLADDAMMIEQEKLGEAVGCQDQIWAAFGGFNRIDFRPDGYEVSPIICTTERRQLLESHLMLWFTGVSRQSSDISKATIANLRLHSSDICTLMQMAIEATGIIADPQEDIALIGKMLHESWLLKRSLAATVSTDTIDDLYEAALANGAIGGKILGAGGGGFLLLFAKPEEQYRIRRCFGYRPSLVEVPFKIENSGSRVVVFEPNGLG